MSSDISPNDPALPQHIAFIMDGNGRWAKQRGLSVSAGHRAGVEAVRGVLQPCRDWGIRAVTLFAFSSENWQRPGPEVRALMSLFSSYLDAELRQLAEDGVRLHFIGRRDRLSSGLRSKMDYAEQFTRANSDTHLTIAVDYGGQWDITQAAQTLAKQAVAGEIRVEDIDEAGFARQLALPNLPLPDLCIRTAFEHRISNFMLWQLAYAELYFSDCYWPDFGREQLAEALHCYMARERRFGGREPGDAE